MVAATLIAVSGRLKEPLEYCHQFGETVHFQTALKFAYVKAMSYQFCCLVQALGKSTNQSPPNFKSLWTVASDAFITMPNTTSITHLNLLKMANMQQMDVIIERHKWSWIGHTLWKDESSVARQAMQRNPLDGIGRRKGRPCVTWRRTVERECKNLNKSCSDLKQLAQSRVRWRVGVVDGLCPGRDQRN